MTPKRWGIFSLIILFIAGLSLCAQSQQYTSITPPDKWEFHVTPYIWVTGFHGDATVDGVPVNDIDDGISNVGFQGRFEGIKGRWGFFVNSTYINPSTDVTTPQRDPTLNVTQWTVDLGGMYRVWSQCSGAEGKYQAVDVFLGGRYWNIDGDLEQIGEFNDSWVDPIVGARYLTSLSRRWVFDVRGDVGGFGVGSDFTWDALAEFGYRTSCRGTLLLGYSLLGVDRETGSGANEFKYDVTFSGPVVGFDYRF